MQQRRLTRSSREKILAGVAGGMADYFSIDPVVMRLIWVTATILTTGLLVPVYFLMWWLMPKSGMDAPGWASNPATPAPPPPPSGEPFPIGTDTDPTVSQLEQEIVTGPITPPPQPAAPSPEQSRQRQKTAGIILVALGVFLPREADGAVLVVQLAVVLADDPDRDWRGAAAAADCHLEALKVATNAPTMRRRRGSLVWPILLIGLGVLFLLQNLGLLPWSTWRDLLPLWPLVLVLFGVELLLGASPGRPLRRMVILAVVAALGVAAVLGLRATVGPTPVETRAFDPPLDGATQADVRVDFAVGQLEVLPLREPAGKLATATFTGPANRIPTERLRRRGDTAELRYTMPERAQQRRNNEQFRWELGGPMGLFGSIGEQASLRVALPAGVPMVLGTQLGVSDARLDLGPLTVSELEVDTGASSAWIRLPETGVTSARVRGGASRVEIEVPAGVGAQIRYFGGVSALHVDEQRFSLVSAGNDGGSRRAREAPTPVPSPPAAGLAPPVRPEPPVPPAAPEAPHAPIVGDRVYRTADFATNPNRVDLLVQVGASSVTIR